MNTLLIDDHPVFREGLALLLRNTFPSVQLQEAGSLQDGLDRLAEDPAIELALLDLALPDSSGVASLQRLREHAPSVTVVVMSADARRDTVLAALDAGAAGFIPKTTNLQATQRAFHVVLDGGVYLPDSVLARPGAPRRIDAPPPACDLGLSPRQLDVLKLLVDGMSNKLIARTIGLSESTVKTHVEMIFRKLDVGSRVQAVMKVAELGWRAPARAPASAY
jgi:DNA-binding NarL/FixJ family response regulator